MTMNTGTGADYNYDAAKQTLRDAAAAYYLDGTSTLTDAAYDTLLNHTAEYETAHCITVDVVGEAIAAGISMDGEVTHTTRMLSLDNVFTTDALHAWAGTVGGLGTLVAEPKLDGMAASIRITDGHPTQMVTRGDGFSGEDITPALALIDNLPNHIMVPSHPLTRDLRPFNGEIRGEVIFAHTQYEAADQARVAGGKTAFVNARSAVAGTVRRAATSGNVPAGTRLSFIAYDTTGTGVDAARTHTSAMTVLENAGVVTAQSLMAGLPSLVTKPQFGFEVDGIVFKVDDLATQNILGSSSRAPRWARAFKFPPETTHTTLIGVQWQVGRTGSVTPRAETEPFYLGSTNRFATLNNPSDIARKDLMLFDTVEVRRAGEVIPQIMGSITAKRDGTQQPIPIPTHCPNCDQVLLTDQARLKCPSAGECATDRKLVYAASRDALNIDGMGPTAVEALIDAGLLATVADIFDLTAESMSQVMGTKTAENLAAEIERSRTEATFDRVLIALSLNGTGRSMSRRIATHFQSMDALVAASVSEVEQVDKMGPVKAASLVHQLAGLRPVIDKLRAHGLAMKREAVSADVDQLLAGMTVVVTGKMVQLGSRSEVTGNLEKLGATVSSSVSAATTLVVTDNVDGTSSKLVKARKLGVRIMDEAAFTAEFGIV